VSAPLRIRQLGGTWTVSDSRTRVTFSVGNLGRRAHGTVPVSWGQLRIDPNGAPIHVQARLDLNGLDTGIARRDADLRKPRLLDVDQHPLMTWEATRFSRTDDGAWIAHGALRVRGTSAPLVLVGTPEPAGADDEWLHVHARGAIDRTAVGIRAPAFLIGRSVEVDLDAWLTPARA
jgi:polyisoprenoid-binding protein YceI